ncbi:MAG: MBL fold metallo-hydrolase [Candidatus Limnocylindria bacterium]
MTLRVTFLGSGNAFADGGRSHACIHISAPGVSLLLDCGGSSLPMIKRHIDPAAIDAIAVSHLHGDHFGGIPFLLDEQKWAFRKRPLVVAGPPSLADRLGRVAEGYSMDISRASLGFDLTFVTLDRTERTLGGAHVAALPVRHSPKAEPHGLRVRAGGKLIAYSGDATWGEELIGLAEGADLFICESTHFDSPDPVHVSYVTLMRHRAELRCERIVLTHLGADMILRLGEVEIEVATDGMLLEL